MNDKLKVTLDRIHRISESANKSYNCAKSLSASDYLELVNKSEFLSQTRKAHLVICVLELSKLIDKKSNQYQNLPQFLEDLSKENFDKKLINECIHKLNSISSIEKINNLRDKVFAHTDDDWMEIVRGNPLQLTEISKAINIVLDVVGSISNTVDDWPIAEFDYSGFPTELNSAQDFLSQYKQLIEEEVSKKD